MRATPRKDTTPELRLRRAIHARGLRYRIDRTIDHASRRRVDIVFVAQRVAVFVDGCFWHGCASHATWPKNNAAWWRTKILANRRRDLSTNRRLRSLGWRVVRVWEHEDVDSAVARILRVLDRHLRVRYDAG